jgi:hypothetical protein
VNGAPSHAASPIDWPLTRPAASGVGSVPHGDVESALAFVAATAPRAPYRPELPAAPATPATGNRGDGILERAAGFDPAVVVAPGERLERLERLDRRHLEAEDDPPDRAFTAALESKRFAFAELITTHVCGAATLAAALAGGRPDERWLRAATARVDANAERQIASFARHVPARARLLVVFDEPSLGSPGEAGFARVAPFIRALLDAARRRGALAGIHCCGELAPQRVASLDPDVFSFDATSRLESMLADRDMVEYAARGRAFALGVLATTSPPDPGADTARRIRAAYAALRGASRFPPLLTASCGLGRTPLELAGEIAGELLAIERSLAGDW